MRRPLFGTGIPTRMSGGDQEDTVLTLAGQSPGLQSRVRGLTLWAMVPDGGAAQTVRVEARENNGGGSATLLSKATGGSGFSATKLLDRYPMRGDVEVVAAAAGDASTDPIYLYGYYQIEGERTISREYRPLQPELHTIQTNYLAAAQSGEGLQRVHAFSPDSIDVVRLWGGGHAAAGEADLLVCDGRQLIEVKLDTGAGAPIQMVWDSLPVQAREGEVDGLSAGVYLRTSGDGQMTAWGMFNRG